MFLQNQFFFYRFYFKIMDPIKCIIFTWNPKLEYFEMSRSLFTKRICVTLNVFLILHSLAATFIFLVMKMKGQSTMSMVFHLLFLTMSWYCVPFRIFYTTKAKELVNFMNIAILLEKRHSHSKVFNSLFNVFFSFVLTMS